MPCCVTPVLVGFAGWAHGLVAVSLGTWHADMQLLKPPLLPDGSRAKASTTCRTVIKGMRQWVARLTHKVYTCDG